MNFVRNIVAEFYRSIQCLQNRGYHKMVKKRKMTATKIRLPKKEGKKNKKITWYEI